MAASVQSATMDNVSAMENNGTKFTTEIVHFEEQERNIPEEGHMREKISQKQKQSELAEELRLLSYCRLHLSLTDPEERKLSIILKERCLTREEVRQGWMWKRSKNTANQIYATARGKNESRARKCVSLLQDVSPEVVSVPNTKETDATESTSPSKQFHSNLTPNVKRMANKMGTNKVDKSEESRKMEHLAPSSGTGSIVSTPTCSRSTSKQEVSEEICSKEDNEDNEVIYYTTDMADSESLDSVLGDVPLYPETEMAAEKVAKQDRSQADVASMISHGHLPRRGLRGHLVRMCCCLVPQSEEMATTGFQAPMELVPTSVLNDNFYITAESQASTEDMSTVLTAVDGE